MMDPNTKPDEGKPAQDPYDEAVEESFPCSDAPAAGGATRIEGNDEGEAKRDGSAKTGADAMKEMDEPGGPEGPNT